MCNNIIVNIDKDVKITEIFILKYIGQYSNTKQTSLIGPKYSLANSSRVMNC